MLVDCDPNELIQSNLFNNNFGSQLLMNLSQWLHSEVRIRLDPKTGQPMIFPVSYRTTTITATNQHHKFDLNKLGIDNNHLHSNAKTDLVNYLENIYFYKSNRAEKSLNRMKKDVSLRPLNLNRKKSKYSIGTQAYFQIDSTKCQKTGKLYNKMLINC